MLLIKGDVCVKQHVDEKWIDAQKTGTLTLSQCLAPAVNERINE